MANYVLIDGILYKKGYSLPYLHCLDSNEAKYIIEEIDKGIYSNHTTGRSLAYNVIK